MNSREFVHLFSEQEQLKTAIEALVSGKTRIGVNGSVGSHKAVFIHHLHKVLNRDIVLISKNEEDAEYLRADISAFTDHNSVFLWRDSFLKSFDLSRPAPNKIQANANTLDHLSAMEEPRIVVTYPEALIERIIKPEDFEKSKLSFKVNDEVDLDFLIEVLNEYGFYREDFVYEPGQFSIRGGIIDLYSFAGEHPFRLELDGRTIESIREFDPISQLSTKRLVHTTVVPNVQESVKAESFTNLFEFLGRKSLVISSDLESAFERLNKGIEKAKGRETTEHQVNEVYLEEENLVQIIAKQQVVEFGSQTFFRPSTRVGFNQTPQPPVNKNFNLLIDTLISQKEKGYEVLIFSESHKQVERLESIFDDLNSGITINPIYKNLSEGFIDHELKVAAYTEHQIFNRYYLAKSGKRTSTTGALSLKELKDLNPGDYVVHIDHGVGQFKGLQRMEMGGKMQEAVRIEYKNGDLLYLNIGSLYKISKFKGKDGQQPKINKLGSDAWANLKRKTKRQVKDIARDLIELYAKRKAEKGFEYSPDSYLQTELEASFIYEDTPDQAKATEDVKADMEGHNPMDRLVCGDVGFGKTEIAIRAAFKAVTDGKQVAILVPTTILAQQHHHTFRDRLLDFPCTVDYINRFRSTKQQNDTLQKLEEGKVDIVIGTHKLLNKKTKFKDLGLLIIDEEQKFGVSAKEKLKAFKANIDSLTLTATPIPRTLHFSLMGARDLSIIQTPPANRRPVQTEVHVWNDQVIEEAISSEIARGGQAFVIHNRVKDINEVAQRIRNLVPHARVAIGHGQMKGHELEEVMVQFIEGEFDVLVATTIIESGLDIPNANTIVINNAHMFGLSDLHQMRGRVGRSNVKAYCYLLAPPLYGLPEDGRRRLQAIEEYSDLGSGFNVAMRDLDIRGAGNLLGAEQSGFISEIGFQMYHKILDEAIKELKEEEFKGVLEEENEESIIECTVEPDFVALLPDHYVSNVAERINLYTQLSQLNTHTELEIFREQLEDRFGNPPREVTDLLLTVDIKIVAQAISAEKVRIQDRDLFVFFNNNLGDNFYTSPVFTRILAEVNTNAKHFQFKQGKQHLILAIRGFRTIKEAMEQIEQFGT